MYKTVIEEYYKKGWLNHGVEMFSGSDRLLCAQRLYCLYVMCGEASIHTVDFDKPRVDGGKMFCMEDRISGAKGGFFSLWGKLPKECRKLLEIVVLNNERLFEENKSARKMLKKNLSGALDCLIFCMMDLKFR